MATLGSIAVGDTVKIKYNGALTEFIVIHQGLPSGYDASCNGTWVMIKDPKKAPAVDWDDGSHNKYNGSISDPETAGVLAKFDASMQSKIKSVTLDAAADYVSEKVTKKVFLPCAGEVGCSQFWLMYFMGVEQETGEDHSLYGRNVPQGSTLSYFSGGSADKRNCGVNWVLRSCAHQVKRITRWGGNSDSDFESIGIYRRLYVEENGTMGWAPLGTPYYLRFAMVLPTDLTVGSDNVVSANTAPSMPASITIPTAISGGTTIKISWTASTDAQGNLAGYRVQRSVNGGNAWTQIYQGTATTENNLVEFGTPSVMYRVAAYDTEGLQSGWRTSGQVVVVNNRAPNAPPTITVPSAIKGGQKIVVSWQAATDPDSNLTGYELQRAINGTNTWTTVYTGANTSYTDTITKGWTKVKYQVRSKDKYNLTSGWTVSAERAVENNTAPTITCANADKSDLGTKTAGFSVTYSVDDVDAGDTLTVTETMDGVQKRSYSATRKQNNTFEVTDVYFQKILNGKHTMVISVSDGKVTVTRTLTFTKSVRTVKVTLKTPLAVDQEITVCSISVSGTVPPDAEYKVEVTNNAKDDSPVWEDATAQSKNGYNHVFTNKTQTKGWAFNFRVTATGKTAAGFITSVQGGFQ